MDKLPKLDYCGIVAEKTDTMSSSTFRAGERMRFNAVCPAFPYLLGEMSNRGELGGERSRWLEQVPELLNCCTQSLTSFCHTFESFRVNRATQIAENEVVPLSPQNAAMLRTPIETFLVYSILLQNAWHKLLTLHNRDRSIQIPSSLNDLMKALNKPANKFSQALPDFVLEPLISYWDQHGKKLRAYRDYMVHFGIVTSDAREFISDSGGYSIHLLLPKNPEVKSEAKLEWQPDEVHAFTYCWEEFRILVWLTSHLVVSLLEPAADQRSQIITMGSYRPRLAFGGDVRLPGITSPAAAFQEDIHKMSAAIYPFERRDDAQQGAAGDV